MGVNSWPAVGIHYDIPPSVYFAPQGESRREWMVSKSLLWDFAKNPRRWLESPPKEVTDPMRWGSLVDCLTLTPKRFKEAYVIQPESYVSAPEGEIVIQPETYSAMPEGEIILTTEFEGEWNGKLKACREWKAAREGEGKVVMTPEQLDDASQPKPWSGNASYCREWRSAQEKAGKTVMTAEQHAEALRPKPWNWNSTTCQAWRDALPAGVEIVNPFTLADAEKASRKLCTRPEFQEMMHGAATQVAMRFDFPSALHGVEGLNVRAKGLLDIVPAIGGKWGSSLVDLKTIRSLDDMDQVERAIYTMGYHAQAALYLDMWNALTGENREGFAFVFQLSVAPYEVAVVELDPSAIVAGREWYLGAIRKWAETVTSGEWTSPWDGIKWAKLPKWSAGKEAA